MIRRLFWFSIACVLFVPSVIASGPWIAYQLFLGNDHMQTADGLPPARLTAYCRKKAGLK